MRGRGEHFNDCLRPMREHPGRAHSLGCGVRDRAPGQVKDIGRHQGKDTGREEGEQSGQDGDEKGGRRPA